MRKLLVLCSMVTLGSLTVPAASPSNLDTPDEWLSWSLAEPVNAVNSAAADGCPIESQDGLSLYIASTRFGGGTGNDIWAADRSRIDLPFGAPVKLEAPVNTDANDFCPTPIHGSFLLFVSERAGPDTCAAGPGRPNVNNAGSETRSSISRDGLRLYFGRDGEIFSASRAQVPGSR